MLEILIGRLELDFQAVEHDIELEERHGRRLTVPIDGT
jgi:hypothetical protein